MKPRLYPLRFLFSLALLGAALSAPLLFGQAPSGNPGAPGEDWPAPAIPEAPAVPASGVAPGPAPAPATPPSRPATPDLDALSPALEEPDAPIAPPALPPEGDAPPASLPPPVEPRRALFRIGYLAPAAESPLGQEWYRSLKTSLETNPALSATLAEAGISGVALRPSGHPEDLLQRMLAEEFDLVFCPAMVYVQERLAQQNRGFASRYRVMFRTQRRQDAPDTRSSEQVRHRGVLFVRRGSALGQKSGDLGVEDVKSFLHSATLAVSGSYDAAGFFYIRKMLWEEFDRSEPGEFLYCGAPQEAVKSVISGLCDAGACEESVLREVIASISGNKDARDFIRVIRETKPLPTDPVLIHERFDPVGRRSELGRALYDALRAIYDQSRDPAAPRLVPGTDAAYDPMEDDLRLTRQWGW